MGIKIRKKIVIGSMGAVILIVLASFSSVVSAQTIQSQADTRIQSFKNKLQETVDIIQDIKANQEFGLLEELRENARIEFTQNLDSLKEQLQTRQTASSGPEPGRLLVVLILTILTEFAVYSASLKSNIVSLFLISVIINSITNPATNLVYYTIYDNVPVLEALVVVVESFMIYVLFNAASITTSFSQAVMLSALANLFSYIIATGLTRLIYDYLAIA